MKNKLVIALFAVATIVCGPGARTTTVEASAGLPPNCGEQGHHIPPPAGFRPEAATEAELRCYGFPTRPAGGDGLTSWTYAMEHYRQYVTPAWHVGPSIPRPSATGAVTPFAGSGNSSEAGYNVSGTWQYVSGYITIPTGVSVSDPNHGLSEWNGIQSSAYGAPLAQAGAAISVKTNYTWQLFWEVNVGTLYDAEGCNQAHYDSSISVSPGDQIYTDFEYAGPYNGYLWTDFYWEDVTTGQANQLDAYCDYGGTGVAQYYIEENPGNYITWNSQSLMFSKCQLSTGNGQYYYFDRYPYTAVKMSDPTGTYTEAQPSGVNTTTHGFYIDSTA